MNSSHETADALPAGLQKYFWDCDFSALSIEKQRRLIIERVLNFGNDDAVRWLLAHVDRANIADVLEHSRNLSEKTRNFWNIMIS